MTEPHELSLIIRDLQSSDPDCQQRAWAILYATLNPELEKIWKSWNLSPDDASDVVAETWQRVWIASGNRSLPAEADAFRKYVTAICRNLLRDGFRAADHNVPLEKSEQDAALKEFFVTEVGIGDGDTSLSVGELTELRAALLEVLSPPERELYTLWTSGKGPVEIAEVLQISRGAVDTRMSRLRKRLRQLEHALRLYRYIWPPESE